MGVSAFKRACMIFAAATVALVSVSSAFASKPGELVFNPDAYIQKQCPCMSETQNKQVAGKGTVPTEENASATQGH